MATYLGIGITTVATISLILQTIAYLVLIIGFTFARKKNFRRHKRVMSVATLINLTSLFIVMLPSFYSIVSGISFPSISSISLIMIVHHSLGLLSLVLASIVILRSCMSITKNRKILMLTIFSTWSLAYFLGIYVYLILYYPVI